MYVPALSRGTDASKRQSGVSENAGMRLPPVVFVGHIAQHAVPNNFPLSRLMQSRVLGLQERVERQHGEALLRKARACKQLRRGIRRLQGMVLQGPENDTLASDDEVPLQRHIGVRSNRRDAKKPQGLDFNDVALLGSTVAGGTLMGISVHQWDSTLLSASMQPLPAVATVDGHLSEFSPPEPRRAHESVASHSTSHGGVGRHTDIEVVVMQRSIRASQRRESNDSSPLPISLDLDDDHVEDFTHSRLRVRPRARDHLEVSTATGKRSSPRRAAPSLGSGRCSPTLLRRFYDRDVNFVPFDHAEETAVQQVDERNDAATFLRSMRQRRNLRPPTSVVATEGRQHRRCTPGLTAVEDGGCGDALPVSLELAYEAHCAKVAPVIGGGTHMLFKELLVRGTAAAAAPPSPLPSLGGAVDASLCIRLNRDVRTPSGRSLPSPGRGASREASAGVVANAVDALEVTVPTVSCLGDIPPPTLREASSALLQSAPLGGATGRCMSTSSSDVWSKPPVVSAWATTPPADEQPL